MPSERAPVPDSPLLLIVDGDGALRAEGREALEPAGFAIAEAASAEEALAGFAELRPRAVLLDDALPDACAFATCGGLRELDGSAATPLLLATRCEDPENVARGYQSGATDLVARPVNWALLQHRLDQLLRSSDMFQALQRSQDSLSRAQRISKLGSWEWNPERDLMRWSEETFRIFGLPPASEPTSAEQFWSTIHPSDLDEVRQKILAAQEPGAVFAVEHRLFSPDQVIRYVRQQGEASKRGDGLWISGTIQDVTDQTQAQQRIRYLADYDALTGLPNRRLFRQQLERAIAAAREKDHLMALLYMDLDHFKRVNDTLGHTVGDELLKLVADRFREQVRGSDLIGRLEDGEPPPEVSRLGGDEFTILLSKISAPDDAGDVARRIIDSLRAAIQVDTHRVSTGASIGIAVYPMDGEDAESLMKNADAAMYRAKELSRNCHEYFCPALNAEALRKLTLESRLREALEREELRVFYQPRVDLGTARVVSAEALLRWEHPELGMVRPAEFIPLSEDTGLIVPLGRWVLEQACRQNKAWQEAGYDRIRVSVNVSPRQFAHGDLLEVVTEALSESGLDPRDLELEITESVFMHDGDSVAEVLRQLQIIGVRVAIDDFGTGFSSLNYLRSLPIDTLKLDRCFVREVDTNPGAGAIANAVITMARGLGLSVVAEGVDAEGQERYLRGLGCDEMQGFWVSAAVPGTELVRFLQRTRQPAERAIRRSA